MNWQCYWWREMGDLLEHRRSSFGHTGWGCSEGKHLGIHPGAGRTGPRNEPGGMSRSQSLTPADGQWDTWQRGWSSGPLHITIHLTFSHSYYTPQTIYWGGHLLVLDEEVSHGIVRVWWVSGVAVLQNNCKAWISVLHRHAHIQRWAHWQGDLDCWISLSVVGVAEQRHGGSGFGTWAWNPTCQPVKKMCFFVMRPSVFFPGLHLVIVTFLNYSKRFWTFLGVSECFHSYTKNRQQHKNVLFTIQLDSYSIYCSITTTSGTSLLRRLRFLEFLCYCGASCCVL